MNPIILARIFIPLIVLITPLLIYEAAMDQVMHPRFLYLSCVISLGLIAILAVIDKKIRPKLTGLDGLFGLFYGVNLLSIIVASNQAEAIFETQKLFLMLGTYGILRYFLSLKSREKEAEESPMVSYLLTILAILSTVICMYSIFILADIYKEFGALYHSSVYAIKGLFAHKNLLSAFLVILLPFSVWGAFRLQSIFKWLCYANIPMIIGLVFLLQTRAAYVGIFLLIMILGIGLLSNKKVRSQLPLKHIALGGLGIIIASMSILAVTGNIAAPFKRLLSFGKTNSVQERQVLWQKSLELVKDFPILGVGNGNWKLMYPKNSVTGLKRAEMGDTQFVRPHNDFLWIWSENGTVGFLLFMSIFGWIVWTLIRSIRKAESLEETIALWSLLSGIIAYLAISFFDFPRERLEHQMILACYFAFIAYFSRAYATARPINLPISGKLLLVPLVALALITSYIGYSRLQSELIVKELLANTRRGQWKKVKRNAMNAHTPFFNMDLLTNPLPWWEAIADYRNKKHKEANKKFKEAISIHPYSHKVYNNLGSSHYVLKEYDKALEYYERSLAINPKYEETLANMAQLYLVQKQNDKARLYINKIEKNIDRKKKLLEMLK